MKVWVVTGPIGAGKSSFTTILAQRGAVVVDADLLGHEVLQDPAIIASIAKDFGSQCIVDGQVNRQNLGALVFADEVSMDKLNALIHPLLIDLVVKRLSALEKEGNHELAVLEAAVYFLWPPLDRVDLVISVVAQVDLRLNRLVKDRGLKTEQARNRLQAQAELDHFWNTADVVIDNSFSHHKLNAAATQLLLKHNL